VRQIERLPELAKDELGVPDACLLFFDEVLAFDHVRKEIWLVVTADVTTANTSRRRYDKAVSGSTSWRSACAAAAHPWPKQGRPRASSR
jgi:anthranilate synthase component 1